MRVTEKAFAPEDISAITKSLEEKKKEEEGLIKPVKYVPIAHFCNNKCDKKMKPTRAAIDAMGSVKIIKTKI